MKKNTLYSWIINHFTYTQIYFIFCIIIFLSILPLVYFWITIHLDHIHAIDEQLEKLEEEKIFKNLFFQVQQHRQNNQQVLLGFSEYQLDKETLEAQIRHSLQEATTAINQRKFLQPPSPAADSLLQKGDTKNLETQWINLTQQLHSLTPNQGEDLYTNFINNLLVHFGYLSNKKGMEYLSKLENYFLLESVFLRFPFIQEHLSRLALQTENALASQQKNIPNKDLLVLMGSIESDLNFLQYGIDLTGLHFPKEEHEELLKTLNSYRAAVQEFINLVQKGSLENNPTLSLSQLTTHSNTALKLGFQLWEEGLEDLKNLLQKERKKIFDELWLVLLLTLLLIFCAFFFSLGLVRKATTGLKELTFATDSFTNGNLSIRIPVIYNDEIGRQAHAFNRLAQKLEEIVHHLYELLTATTALANGDLTARIQMRNDNPEFDQVALSFNKMAETFETIINRLRQIGIILTTSATEIAIRSKEQEIIIFEQESATREISVAANEISSTAKEFAHTMNDISGVAEKTSHLALTGKDSLNNMESIMRQMVEASRTIASKLAVLKEKAGSITTVITTITKVADQTNLLSLNASIEAEKAGEFGRSFAVIAREIRRLADQTAVATLDIEKMVHEIMTAVSSSVMGVDDFTQDIRNGVEQVRTVSEQLGTIIEQVQAFIARFELVNQGMQTQSKGAEQINEAIAQLSQTARLTTEAIHLFHKTIEELNNAASELKNLTPFLYPKLEEQSEESHPNETSPNSSFDPHSMESKQRFNKTLSDLNLAAKKLKDLNTQLNPPSQE